MDQIGRLNALHATTNTVKASNVNKAGNVSLFSTKVADDGSYYPGLNISSKARMAAFLDPTKNPEIACLNSLFGIKQ